MRRLVLFVVAAAVIVLSWVPVIVGTPNSISSELTKLLQLAEEQMDTDAYGAAISIYYRALEIENTVEIRLLLSDALLGHGENMEYVKTLRALISEFPQLPEPYIRLARYYIRGGEGSQGVEVISQAVENKVPSIELKDLYYRHGFNYEYMGGEYMEAGAFYNGYATVSDGEAYRVIKENMRFISSDCFEAADNFFGNTAAVKRDNKYYIIDTKGRKHMNIPGEYSVMRSYSEGVSVAEKDGVYGVVDSLGQFTGGEYSYISNFNNGVAAAKQGNYFVLLNPSMGRITETTYEDISVGQDNMCSRERRVFVRESGSYYMITLDGDRVGEISFDEVRAFQDGPAAVKRNGKWGYVDTNGDMIIDFTYEDATSFSNGLAAVKIDGLWGYIDSCNVVVIEPSYRAAGSFSESGIAPVMAGDKWRYIKLIWRDEIGKVLDRKP